MGIRFNQEVSQFFLLPKLAFHQLCQTPPIIQISQHCQQSIQLLNLRRWQSIKEVFWDEQTEMTELGWLEISIFSKFLSFKNGIPHFLINRPSLPLLLFLSLLILNIQHLFIFFRNFLQHLKEIHQIQFNLYLRWIFTRQMLSMFETHQKIHIRLIKHSWLQTQLS